MLAMGRALMAGPELLLLDEPSLGLAPLMVERIADVVRRIHAQGTSVLLVEQNATMALGLADAACVLDVGEVRLAGPARELARTGAVRRLYLGEPPAADAPSSAGRGRRDRPRRGGRPPPLHVRDVTVRFAGLTALDGVSFSVAPARCTP